MARKGHQQRSGWDRNSSTHKNMVSDSGYAVRPVPDNEDRKKELDETNFFGYGIANAVHPGSQERLNKSGIVGSEKKSKHKSGRTSKKERHGIEGSLDPKESISGVSNSGDQLVNASTIGASFFREETLAPPCNDHGGKHSESSSAYLPHGLHFKDMLENFGLSDSLAIRSLRVTAFVILKLASEWLERRKPVFISTATNILNVCDYIKLKIEQAYPLVLHWLMHFGNVMLLLSMVWLDYTLRGIISFLTMGTTSFFSVICCSIFSTIAMIGMSTFIVVMGIASCLGILVGFSLAVLVLFVSGTYFLWFYGSFWTSSLVIFFAGLAFSFGHERLSVLVATVYSVYCTWTYYGWFILLVILNFSFISSDALIYLLKNHIHKHVRTNGSPDQASGVHGQPDVGREPVNASSSDIGSGRSVDRGPGAPSTSGRESERTSEDEVVRLLNCSDHYSALGLLRYANVDISVLKREYRKKAMLVHPDKNMGNERAAEAFKKLQSAYEVLVDSLKRKAYDDELKREELLNYFLRFQSVPQKKGRRGFFGRSEVNNEDPFGESRQIACKTCGNFHTWAHTRKLKSRARWCQDCKDFHPAKDGDGWIEQSSQPFLFGIFQKVDAPSAYVCVESRIYDVSEWYVCQGMRCPANVHKPSFHVNTSLISKHNTGKGSSGQRGGIPKSNTEESMTEEEFFEWLQNAMQAGTFEGETPSEKAANFSKSSGSNKKKKKGKKQW